MVVRSRLRPDPDRTIEQHSNEDAGLTAGHVQLFSPPHVRIQLLRHAA